MKKKSISFMLSAFMFFMVSQVFAQNTYFAFGGLNYSSVDVGTDWVKLETGTYTFTKGQNDTDLEVYVNTRFHVADMDAGVMIKVRIDDNIDPDYGNYASLTEAYSNEFQSIFAVFQDLPAGSHTVSLWAKASSGNANGVIVDPAGWGGKIIVKIIGETTVAVPEHSGTSENSILEQNHPNPFYPKTTIEYTVEQPGVVELNVFNGSGQLVKTLVNEYKTAGKYSVVWNSKDSRGRTVSPGNYFYQIKTENQVSTKKMIVVK